MVDKKCGKRAVRSNLESATFAGLESGEVLLIFVLTV